MPPAIAIPESSSAARPGRFTSSGRVTHNSAMHRNTMPTRFSGTVMLPISSFIARSAARPCREVRNSTWKTQRVSASQASGSIAALSGKPTSIQRAKSISTP